MTKKQNYVTGQGETFVLNLILEDAQGNPVDLTGHTITLALKYNDVLVADYATVVDDAGTITLKVTDEETAVWPVGNCKYVLIHDQPNGDRKYMAYGNLTVAEVF
ncbi:hypothetical protein [Nocardioides abyssi]|uniref:BppU N-terminal domain-containing protein n=1 Tax=Nocardioides abyssi TaxID=3058370 RepID=A0ABT8EXU4_9ACTN|nr:hypothetical protein [Nocardioides abyssi]MDN4162938.1 hypothetical protein [Nocardioides abyssi]